MTLYCRFTAEYKNVENLSTFDKVILSYETWWLTFHEPDDNRVFNSLLSIWLSV